DHAPHLSHDAARSGRRAGGSLPAGLRTRDHEAGGFPLDDARARLRVRDAVRDRHRVRDRGATPSLGRGRGPHGHLAADRCPLRRLQRPGVRYSRL
ncbi:MAG: hypothetical protein AVDCRST_MAG18-3909, partial [uncultured Thermomicrobiales bacterium]